MIYYLFLLFVLELLRKIIRKLRALHVIYESINWYNKVEKHLIILYYCILILFIF